MDGAQVASVVPMCVLPSESVGRDPTYGVDLDGAAPAHDHLSAVAGSKMVGSPRRSMIGTKAAAAISAAQ
jgi:hypothetical protein